MADTLVPVDDKYKWIEDMIRSSIYGRDHNTGCERRVEEIRDMAEKMFPWLYSFTCKYNEGMYKEDEETWNRFETWLVKPAMHDIRDHRPDPKLVLAYLNLPHLSPEHMKCMVRNGEYKNFAGHYGRLAAVLADDAFQSYAMVIQCWRILQLKLSQGEEVTDEFVHQQLHDYMVNAT